MKNASSFLICGSAITLIALTTVSCTTIAEDSSVAQTNQKAVKAPKSVVGKIISISFDKAKVFQNGEWSEWKTPQYDIDFCMSADSSTHRFKEGNIATDKGGRFGAIIFHYQYIEGNNAVLEWYSKRNPSDKKSILLTFTSPNFAIATQKDGADFDAIKDIEVTVQ